MGSMTQAAQRHQPDRIDLQLRRALAEIGARTPLEQLTTAQLVRRARIGRSTFYRRHADLGAYVESVRADVLNEVASAFQSAQDDAGPDAGRYSVIAERVSAVLQVIHHHADLLRLFCRDTSFQNRCRTLTAELMAADLDQLGAGLDARYCPPEHVLAFVSHGLVGVLSRWLHHPAPEDVDDLAFHLVTLISGATTDFIE